MEEWLDGDRPAIIDDVVLHLTGVELQPAKPKIREEDEFQTKKILFPDHFTNDEMTQLKKELSKPQYLAINEAFANLWGKNNVAD